MTKRILVIDDEKSIAEMIKDNLELRGYKVDVASDGIAGFEKIKETKPDAVILDIIMPGMDGYQVLRVIKKDKETKYVPVILISSYEAFVNSKDNLEIDSSSNLQNNLTSKTT